jgi:hypothetical protein
MVLIKDPVNPVAQLSFLGMVPSDYAFHHLKALVFRISLAVSSSPVLHQHHTSRALLWA